MPSEKYYKVNEFVKLCGVTPRTLKYYETHGLLRPALVGENGYRYYSLSQIDEFRRFFCSATMAFPSRRSKPSWNRTTSPESSSGWG